MKNTQSKLNEKNLEGQISEQVEQKKESKNRSYEMLQKKNIVLNTSVKITVELGTTKIKIQDFLNLTTGSILILDKSSQEPLKIFINNSFIASGEIVFLEKKYGLRITNINKSLKPINSTV